MQFLYPVWFFFAAIFAYLGYAHWRQSTIAIRPFYARGIGEGESSPSESASTLTAFIRDFNKYLEMVNASNKSVNRNASVGYFVAAAVSVLAIFLSSVNFGG